MLIPQSLAVHAVPAQALIRGPHMFGIVLMTRGLSARTTGVGNAE